MKYLLNFTSLLVISLFCTTSLVAQSNLKKANKQYELAAYHLAINSYQKVLAKDADNVEALAKMADSYRHLNQMEEAAKWYRLAIQQSGVDPIHIFGFGKTLMAMGDYDRAKEWFLIYGEGQPVAGNHFAESCDFANSIKEVLALYTVTNEFGNSAEADFAPTFYNNQVVFASARQDIKRNNKATETAWEGSVKNQLFISSLDKNGFLGRPAYLRSDLKSNFNEGPLSYSADGKFVAYTKNNFINGTRQIPSSGLEMSIYLAEVTSQGDWTNAQPFPFNGSGYSSAYPYLTKDGNTMYFASDRPDGFGGYDIYVTYRTGKTWSTPENLGPVINSKGDEITPFVSGTNLYFSSNWHHGMGGFDIFRAEQAEGIYTNVFHLGTGINSSYDDYGYIYKEQEDRGYMVSNRPGGKGKEDIYQFTKSTQRMLIVVADEKTKKPLSNALVDFTACGEPVFKTDARGEYRFQAMDGLSCEIVVRREGYQDFTFNINSSKNAAQSFEILLIKAAEIKKADDYLGKIVNAQSNRAVNGVRIKATDQSTRLVIETTSNLTGDYRLPLDPARDYLIRYSKAGYLDMHQRVTTGNGKDRSILGVLTFPPSGTNVEEGATVVDYEEATTLNNAGSGSTETPTEVVEVVTSVSTVTLPAPLEQPDPYAIEAQEGFSVQLAAVPNGQPVEVGKYQRMDNAGNIYSKAEGGYKKVRVGIYPTKAEAKAIQDQARAKGYKSAFVVAEKIASLRDMEIYSETKPVEDTPPATPNTTPAPPKENLGNQAAVYKVQIASYKNMAFFKRARASAIGKVEERKKGNFTIILLGDYDSVATAKAAQTKAVTAGYKDAYIVKDMNGKLEKVD